MGLFGSIFKTAGKIIVFPLLYFILFSFQGVLGVFGFYLGKLFSIILFPVTIINTYLYDVALWVLLSSSILAFFFVLWWVVHLVRKFLFS